MNLKNEKNNEAMIIETCSFKSNKGATKKNPRSHSESLYVTYLDLNKVLLRVAERAAEAPQHRLHAVQFICVSRASLHR